MGGCLSKRQEREIIGSKTQIFDTNICKSMISDSIFRNESGAEQIVLELMKQIQEKSPKKANITAERIFRASQFKFKAADFHKQCDNKSNTIVIACSSQNRIFGGYTPCPWVRDDYFNYEVDSQGRSFLFTVDKESQLVIFKLKEKEKAKAIMNHEQSGPIFGEGHDLYINDQCDKRQSWNNLGKSYESKNQKYGSQKANKLLSGQQRHKIKEYEVWEIAQT